MTDGEEVTTTTVPPAEPVAAPEEGTEEVVAPETEASEVPAEPAA